MTTNIEPFLSELVEDLRNQAKRVVDRVTKAIGEIGYDQFVGDVTDGAFHDGSSELIGFGDDRVNVIPGSHPGECRSLLVAVSKGDKRAIGFTSVMRQVREHLIRCEGKAKGAIVLCDHWHPNMLDEHLGDLRAHHAKNRVRFLFLMVGVPNRGLGAVAVDLSQAP